MAEIGIYNRAMEEGGEDRYVRSSRQIYLRRNRCSNCSMQRTAVSKSGVGST